MGFLAKLLSVFTRKSFSGRWGGGVVGDGWSWWSVEGGNAEGMLMKY